MISGRRGLFCRFPGGCEVYFSSDGSVEGVREAAGIRNDHELNAHDYRHRRDVLSEFGFRQYGQLGGISSMGRSTLNLRKKGHLT